MATTTSALIKSEIFDAVPHIDESGKDAASMLLPICGVKRPSPGSSPDPGHECTPVDTLAEEELDETSPKAAVKRPRPNREGVRRGKWTIEEQAYAHRLIRDFEAGLLPLENGATLRAFLSKKLNCDPMRISKKFAGSKCLGKQIFLKRNTETEDCKYEDDVLKKLEADFLRSISNVSTSSTTRRRNRTTGGNSPKKDAIGSSSPKSKLSSDEGETDEETDSEMMNQPILEKMDTSGSSDEDSNCSSDESSSQDELSSGTTPSVSLLAIEDIREAMNSLSAELVDLPMLGFTNTTVAMVVAEHSSQGVSVPHDASAVHCSILEEDLTFLAGDLIEPLSEFLPDECFPDQPSAVA